MQLTEQQLWEQLEAAQDMEPGEAQLEATRDIVRGAEAGTDRDLLAEARLSFVDARFRWVSGPEDVADLIVMYVRTVSQYAEHPEDFSERLVSNLWRGLMIVGTAMVNLADHPAGQIRAMLSDMERRCRPDRNDPYAIALMRMWLETQTGDTEAALRAANRLRTLDPPDYLNPGAAWLEMAQCLTDLGRDEDAIRAVELIHSGQIPTDGDQPPDFSDLILLPLLRTGRHDEARDAHLRHADQELSGHQLAAHLEFCARSGNEERGLEILRDNIETLDLDTVSWLAMRENAAAALLCRRVVELGRGDETLIWPADPDDPDDHDEEWTYARLHRVLADGALDFAGRLDARNATTHQSTWVHALIDAEPVVDNLPITARHDV
jgi:cellulose synthase operon protein C